MESILNMLEWALASVPALIAICGACVLLRHQNGEKRLRNAVNFVALAAVILGNAWLFWVCVSSSSYLHGALSVGAFARFQRSFKIGLFATSLTFAVATFGKGRGRLFALSATIVLVLLWLGIHNDR